MLSIAFASFYFWWITPSTLDFVLGRSDYWNTQVQDVTQYISGMTAYRNEPWHLPLLHIDSINWPSGTTVTFSDAIPLLALFVKLTNSLWPDNVLGFWVLFCFLLLGASAFWAARQTTSSWIVCAVFVALSIQMPALTYRLGHLSLMAHFLLVFAIGLYLKERKYQDVHAAAWATLVFASFYINLYITAMVLAVMLASAGDLFLGGSRRHLWRYLTVPVPLALSFPFMFGSGFGSGVQEGGFSFYSMNLAAPFIGGRVISFPWYAPGTAGQYEGFNYLGLGVLSLLVLAFSTRGLAGRTFGSTLWIICAGLVVYALSNDVYFGSWRILHWDVPAWIAPLTKIFRVPGRFFWPVGYVLALFAAIALSKLAVRHALIVAAVALMVQFIDLRPVRFRYAQSAARAPEVVASEKDWAQRLLGRDTIYLFPKFRCGKAGIPDILPMQSLAAKLNKNITTGYLARYSPDCTATESEIAAAVLKRSVFVFSLTDYSMKDAISLVPEAAVCQQKERWILCL